MAKDHGYRRNYPRKGRKISQAALVGKNGDAPILTGRHADRKVGRTSMYHGPRVLDNTLAMVLAPLDMGDKSDSAPGTGYLGARPKRKRTRGPVPAQHGSSLRHVFPRRASLTCTLAEQLGTRSTAILSRSDEKMRVRALLRGYVIEASACEADAAVVMAAHGYGQVQMMVPDVRLAACWWRRSLMHAVEYP